LKFDDKRNKNVMCKFYIDYVTDILSLNFCDKSTSD